MTLIDKIIRMLEDRTDCEVFDVTDASEIWCTQLRRVWKTTTKGAESFNPVTVEHWYYFSQTIVICEPKFNRKNEMVREQREFATKYGRVGVQVVWAQSLDSVIDAIGPEPSNIGEYLGRKEK